MKKGKLTHSLRYRIIITMTVSLLLTCSIIIGYNLYIYRIMDRQMTQAISNMPHEVQSDEDCAQAVKELLSQGISYSRTASNGNTNTINYALRCGDRVIGKVTLAEDSSKADQVKYDMLPWVVQSAEFDFTGLYSSVEVTVPNSYTVKLNDVALGSEYIVVNDIHFKLLEDYYSSYPNLPVMVTYRYDHAVGQLEPVIYD